MKTKFISILLAVVIVSMVQHVFPETAWFNLLLNDQKVGYYSFDRHIKSEGRQKLIIQEEESLIKFKRRDDIASIKTGSLLEMDETGRLLYFKNRTVQAGSDYEIEGRLIFPQTAYSLVEVAKEEALRPLDDKPVLFKSARIDLTSSLSMDDIEKNRRKAKSISLLIPYPVM